MKEILLTQGKVALVDDSDFKAVSQFKWCAHKENRNFYAVRALQKPDGTRAIQRLHHFLVPDAVRVDHEDGDGLNNQRHNLRPATPQQNGRGFCRKALGTTSKFRGVRWYKRLQKWTAQIGVGGKQTYLGLFSDESDAARAYDIAARKHFGEFASPNFP